MKKLSRISPSDLSSNPRATLRAWQRYEPIVLAAVAKHPSPFTFTPDSLEPSTFVSRIRDAIRGKIAFDYPSSLSVETVSSWFDEVIFKIINKSVYIGPKEALKTSPLLAAVEKSTDLTFSTLSFDEIAAFALLLSNGRLSGPIVITSPPKEVSLLPSYPNFQPLPRPDGSLVLL